MPVSSSQIVTLTATGKADIAEGPCVITSVTVTELSGSAPASVSITSHSDEALLMSFAVAAGQTVVWSAEPVVAGSGIVAACQFGDVAVMVAYR